jgi:hypothetical protein
MPEIMGFIFSFMNYDMRLKLRKSVEKARMAE